MVAVYDNQYYAVNMSRWKTSKTAVFNLSYHLIWCPKYRRKVLTEDVQVRMLELFSEKAAELEVEIVEANILLDHVHLFVKTKPVQGIYKQNFKTGIPKAKIPIADFVDSILLY